MTKFCNKSNFSNSLRYKAKWSPKIFNDSLTTRTSLISLTLMRKLNSVKNCKTKNCKIYYPKWTQQLTVKTCPKLLKIFNSNPFNFKSFIKISNSNSLTKRISQLFPISTFNNFKTNLLSLANQVIRTSVSKILPWGIQQAKLWYKLLNSTKSKNLLTKLTRKFLLWHLLRHNRSKSLTGRKWILTSLRIRTRVKVNRFQRYRTQRVIQKNHISSDNNFR